VAAVLLRMAGVMRSISIPGRSHHTASRRARARTRTGRRCQSASRPGTQIP
jgi:hypothetical protein